MTSNSRPSGKSVLETNLTRPCPECGAKLKLSASIAGRRAPCPKCGTDLQVAADLSEVWRGDEHPLKPSPPPAPSQEITPPTPPPLLPPPIQAAPISSSLFQFDTDSSSQRQNGTSIRPELSRSRSRVTTWTQHLRKHPWASGLVAASVVIMIWNSGLVPFSTSHQDPTDDSTGNHGPVNQHATSVQRQRAPQPANDHTSQEDEQLAEEAARFLFGAMFQEAQRQQTESRQGFDQALDRMRTCSRCGGQGDYRYVDQNGVLQRRSCPTCLGRGSW